MSKKQNNSASQNTHGLKLAADGQIDFGYYEARGRRLQSRAVSDLLRRAGHQVADIFRAAAA